MKRNPTHPLLRGLALTLATLAVLLGILSIPWRGGRAASPPEVTSAAEGRGPLLAGAAARLIDLGPEPTIAGFPRLRWAADGVLDAVSARALVLSEPGCTVALVSAELLLVPGPLAEAVRARVAGLGIDLVVVGATHTHAGPGGWWDSLPGEIGAAGPYRPEAFERLVESLAGALRQAHAALAPATLAVAHGEAAALALNRTGAAVDGRLLSLRVARPDGSPVAEVVSFAAHPTVLGTRNRLISGDWVGRLLAGEPHGVRLFFQGAIGDQSVSLPPAAGSLPPAAGSLPPPAGSLSPPAGSLPPAASSAAPAAGASAAVPTADRERLAPYRAYGLAVGEAAASLAASAPEEAPALAVASATVTLPPIAPGAVPRLLRPAVATLLGGTFPARATVAALRLGAVLLLFTPAEPVEAVGRRWREVAGPGAEVLSLAGDYVGYVDTAARFQAGAGEAGRSYYGPELAARLEAAVAAAARATAAAR